MFWERFYQLCEEKKEKPNPVGKKIGVSSGLITKWKNGTLPKAEHLILLAKHFNVSIDFLLGLSDNPNIYINNTQKQTILSSDQNKLLSEFSRLDRSDKDKTIGYISALLDSDKYEISEKEAI